MEELLLLFGRSADGRRVTACFPTASHHPTSAAEVCIFWAWRWSAGVGKEPTVLACLAAQSS
jgi:hypothetical protein